MAGTSFWPGADWMGACSIPTRGAARTSHHSRCNRTIGARSAPMLDQIMQRFGYAAGELSSDAYFPYIDHIAPTVMLLADNSVMSVMRMPGAPFALVMNSQRTAHKRGLTAFLNASADEKIEVHIHLVKHDATLPAATHAEAVASYAK